MGWDKANDRERGPARESRAREPEAEHGFWVRYWEVLRAKGVRGVASWLVSGLRCFQGLVLDGRDGDGPVLLFRVIGGGDVVPLVGFGIEGGQAVLDQPGFFGTDSDQHFVHLEDGVGLNVDDIANAAVVLARVDVIHAEELGIDVGSVRLLPGIALLASSPCPKTAVTFRSPSTQDIVFCGSDDP